MLVPVAVQQQIVPGAGPGLRAEHATVELAVLELVRDGFDARDRLPAAGRRRSRFLRLPPARRLLSGLAREGRRSVLEPDGDATVRMALGGGAETRRRPIPGRSPRAAGAPPLRRVRASPPLTAAGRAARTRSRRR